MSKMSGKKVYVGLSGGVDSSVSALLLKKAGYDVTGVFIKVWQPDWITCTWKEDRLDAMRVCAALDVPFITLDLENEYKKEVADYMLDEYKAGRTPNPDVMCNKHVKFGAFFDWAMKQGADYIATGHYAQVKKMFDGTFALLKGNDTNKDQSYFLWTLTQRQLSHTLFPIGHLEKPEVRKIAEKNNLITASKKDSQGLCFIGKVDMKDFLKQYIEEKEGEVLNEKREVIGKHPGAIFFTIGERHGFTITKKGSTDEPYYVVSKNIQANTITVSHKTSFRNEKVHGAKDNNPAPGTKEIKLEKVNWMREVPKTVKTYTARARYRQTLEECTIEENVVTFETPQSAISPGQSIVVYDKDECIGGGIIA